MNLRPINPETLNKLLEAKQPKPLQAVPKLDLPKPRPTIIRATPEQIKPIIRAEVLKADAEIAAVDNFLDKNAERPTLVHQVRAQRSRLFSGDIQLDESQQRAVLGMIEQQYACLTGSAGTGKTTTTKAFVDRLQDELPSVDMSKYFQKGTSSLDDPDDDYVIPEEKLIPAIALCAYTGKASQQIKRNFPSDWHSNIMTIHRLLAFYPIYTEELEADGNVKNKMEFVPYYDATNKLPWKIIIIDEAGMLDTNLGQRLIDACTPDTRIYMIGDINQLPPVHGKSCFGFAMAQWPTWELTTIHRQTGANNSIVDNAWRVIHGLTPKPDDTTKPGWKFSMMEIKPDPDLSSRQLRAWLKAIKEGGFYDPLRDVIITPINAENETAGYALGQLPLNRELSLMFQSNDHRYAIDAGRDRKLFAIGDKVMATKNDHDIGVTNGMMGIIKSIHPNATYAGDQSKFGLLADIQAEMEAIAAEEESGEKFKLDFAGLNEFVEKMEVKKTKERGPASHVVTVDFGTPEHPKEVAFSSLSEVESLQIAYVVTCHKMQGGEAPVVIIICHQSHRQMLYREWLYTAITRAQNHVVLLYTPMALRTALNRQKVKGKDLQAKIASFNELQSSDKGKSRINLPKAQKINN